MQIIFLIKNLVVKLQIILDLIKKINICFGILTFQYKTYQKYSLKDRH